MKTFRTALLMFSTALSLALCGCTLDREAAAPEPAEAVDAIVTAELVRSELDSLILPPSLAHPAIPRYDSATVRVFSRLARDTGGETYFSSRAAHVAGVIVGLLGKHAEEEADVVFLIDNTGSMADDIMAIKAAVNDILDVLEGLPRVRIGVACYGDRNVDGPEWYSFTKLSANFDHAREFIARITLNGGGDAPESVYDGLAETFRKFHWDDGKRMVLLLGDAQPLDGALSVAQYDDVVEQARSARIEANIFPVVINQFDPESMYISLTE